MSALVYALPGIAGIALGVLATWLTMRHGKRTPPATLDECRRLLPCLGAVDVKPGQAGSSQTLPLASGGFLVQINPADGDDALLHEVLHCLLREARKGGATEEQIAVDITAAILGRRP